MHGAHSGSPERGDTVDSRRAGGAELLYGLDDKPPLRETLFVALQHVFAVFVGIITPPLLICNALKLDRASTVFLVSMSLFVSGLATLIQTRRIGPVGSGLLSIQGTSFVFLGPIISTAGLSMAAGASATRALGMIFGLCLAGSLVAITMSQFIRLATRLIAPLVTGTVVTLIGLTLIEVGITSMGGGFDARRDGSFGSPQNLLLAAIVVVVIVALNSSCIPRLRMTSVVIGLGRVTWRPSSWEGWICGASGGCRLSPCPCRCVMASDSTPGPACRSRFCT